MKKNRLGIERKSLLSKKSKSKFDIDCDLRNLREEETNLRGIRRKLYFCRKEQILIGEEAEMCIECEHNKNRPKEEEEIKGGKNMNIKGGILVSEGTWSGIYYPGEALKKALENLEGKQLPITIEFGRTDEFKDKEVGRTTSLSYNVELKSILFEGKIEDEKASIYTREQKLRPAMGCSSSGTKTERGPTASDISLQRISLVKEPSCDSSYMSIEEEKKEYPVPTLSELETGLLEKFKQEKTIESNQMSDREKGALGKLCARKLVERTSEPQESGKMKTIWKLKEEG